MAEAKISVLFVCTGNICRSPMAEGVFRRVVANAGFAEIVEIDSAGTHAYHVGLPPDERAQIAAARRGVDISRLRGRRTTTSDFERFDYVLAMDHDNYTHLQSICPRGAEHKLRLFLEFAPGRREREVPDPYFGSHSGFDRVLDMIEEAAEGLWKSVEKQLSARR